jgi:acyl carrier protein
MDVECSVKQFIAKELLNNCALTEIGENQPLIEQGIIDSLGILALLSFIEDTYAVRIGDDDLIPENFETLVAISAMIRSKISARQVA